MKHIIAPALFALCAASAATACPWAGGTFSGNDLNFQAEFSVNADCTEMVFQSSGNAGFQKTDVPETFALSPSRHGWEADIHGVTATLLSGGKLVDFVGSGVNKRLHVEN